MTNSIVYDFSDEGMMRPAPKTKSTAMQIYDDVGYNGIDLTRLLFAADSPFERTTKEIAADITLLLLLVPDRRFSVKWLAKNCGVTTAIINDALVIIQRERRIGILRDRGLNDDTFICALEM